ncbi:hypothetical protein TMatcc_008803 [Talaromyces marneffei ATCC 18224]|nr:uncharacterized protein EYB26_008118 [Talaromyces marneffei]KAE8550749.1 hypothetical protein EYB25_006977 [Talaromyces marneffei]QGA20416.1 hypothetical protein EYB26_008118 [Talaromyces marneffei]
MYSFARPEIAPNIPMESSMFMAGSWEPSLPGLHPDRQMMAQHGAYVTSSHGYYSAPYQQSGIAPFDHSYSTQNSFFNPNIVAYESPLLQDNSDQSLLCRRTPTLNRESHTPSYVQTPYGSRFPPTPRMQNRELVTNSVPINNPREDTSPVRLSLAVTRQKQTHVLPSRKPSAEEVGNHDKPYAYLLYEALRSAKDHKMSLQEIYRWFEDNTNKAGDPRSKGWQSSIRHNLSMNEAFILHNEYPARGKSKNSYWTLTEEALKNGVQSTTRYRNTVLKRPLLLDDMTRHISEAGSRGESALGQHVPKSRRISHYPEAEPKEQFRPSHGYNIQQQISQRQQVDETPGHNMYYQDPSMIFTQSLAPSIIITSTVASGGPQYGYVETHRPSNQFGHDFTQFDT